jgi:GNAT superfamily N-acetyltransferase
VSVRDRLDEHLRAWLGVWPPPVRGSLSVVGYEGRDEPGWDGRVRPVLGVWAPGLGGVVSVPRRLDGLAVEEIGAAVGRPGARLYEAAFRWCEAVPEDLQDAGQWVDPADRRVPPWLKPFNGGVLIAVDDDGRYVAGVGVKHHDDWGHELSVGTEPAAQGKGLGRRLVAQAARRVMADGAVPTYLHAFENIASAKVAEAAGFPDRGWKVLGLGDD